jgi:hypothetical protein
MTHELSAWFVWRVDGGRAVVSPGLAVAGARLQAVAAGPAGGFVLIQL